jgi:hypothetical protein
MNPLRALMLLGSLGKVWSRTRMAKNVYSTISICAYFKMLSDIENGTNTNIVIIPNDEPMPIRQNPLERPRSTCGQRRRERLRQTMNNVNRIINER